MFKELKGIIGLVSLVFLITAVLVVLLQSSKAIGNEEGASKVTILVFSGRPNPVYFIEEEQLFDKIKLLLKKANPNTAFKRDTVIPSRLGYNGMIFETSGKMAGFSETILVYGNDIELRNKEVRFLKDDGSLEKSLLEMALEKKAIDERILEFIHSDK